MTMTNARFWVWVNGSPVKLTVRPGQQLRHVAFHETDEGWHREADIYELDEDCSFVLRTTYVSARDCDGRIDRDVQCTAAMYELASVYDDEDDVSYPAWRQYSYSQRDHSAEAMGY